MKTILSTILISLALLLVGCNGNKKDKSCETELATCMAECEENSVLGWNTNCSASCDVQKDECEEKLKEKSNDDEEETAKEE